MTDQPVKTWIPIEDCEERGIYLIHSRNLGFGVFNGETGFVGVREKFDSRYLFTEYHHDTGSPFGTVRPLIKLGVLPEDIEIKEDYPSECGRCGAPTFFDDSDEAIAEAQKDFPNARGRWAHREETGCPKPSPVRRTYAPLFEFLEKIEQAVDDSTLRSVFYGQPFYCYRCSGDHPTRICKEPNKWQ